MSEHVSHSLDTHVSDIFQYLGNSSDIICRPFSIPLTSQKGALLYIVGIVDITSMQSHILEPLFRVCPTIFEKENVMQYLATSVLETNSIKQISCYKEAGNELLQGNTILLLEGHDVFLSVCTTKWNERAVETPKGQRSLKGPDVGFIENRIVNISLIRKIVKNENLIVQTQTYGEITKTDISLVYINGIVDKGVLQEIEETLQTLSIGAILDSNYIEEALTKQSKSIFPLVLPTDRPDVVTAEILEGKIGIIVDGSPYALVAPATLIQFFQSPDDYYYPREGGLLLRSIRFFAYFLSLYIPGLYVAFTAHHPNLLPIRLLIGFISQRETVPFSTILEVLFIMLLIDIVFESSVRLPQTVSFTLSVFAAIVFGQASVEAHFLQPTSLVVLSVSFIFNSVLPISTFAIATRNLRLVVIILGATLGLYGIVLFSLLLLVHICYLRSFGVPYFSPISPFNKYDQRDMLYRKPLEEMAHKQVIVTKEESMKQTEVTKREDEK